MSASPQRDRRAHRLLMGLLAVEALDEVVCALQGAAWPLIRTDLHLTYTDIGLLLTVPAIFSNIVEPPMAALSDQGRRHLIIALGGLAFAGATWAIGAAHSMASLMAAMLLFYPASGAFVGLGQTAMIEATGQNHEAWMVRWTVAGSLGVVLGPVLLSVALAGGGSWRWPFVALGAAALLLAGWTWRHSPPSPKRTQTAKTTPATWRQMLGNAAMAISKRDVLRWLVLLTVADLVLEQLVTFAPLYMVDVVGVQETTAALVLAAMTTAALGTEATLIAVLKRIDGLTWMRWTAPVVLASIAALLLGPWLPLKIAALLLIGAASAGWYAILQARLYQSLPGQPGMIMAIAGIFALLGDLTPVAMGALAKHWA